MKFKAQLVTVFGGVFLGLLLWLFIPHPLFEAKRASTHHLLQRGYLWQRYWSEPVKEAVHTADTRLDGVVVLGAEIAWDGTVAHPVFANLDWDELRGLAHPCSIGVRVAPFSGSLAEGDARIEQITAITRKILSDARNHGVPIRELQLDFDCPESKLIDYQGWIRQLKPAVSPTPLVITTLPAWLKDAAFPDLVRLADGYVLQVHSVPTLKESGHAVLCDPILARRWVALAAALGTPFSVALPTYWCVAGYNPQGHLISVAMDSIQPAWPPGTHTLEYSVEPDVVADLVKEWRANPPPGMQEIIWYRLPVASDEHNWRWPTLAAVMQGRRPTHRLEIRCEGTAPVDVYLRNSGEAEEQPNQPISAGWSGPATVLATDALADWTVTDRAGEIAYSPPANHGFRLSPGSEVAIGWIRFQSTPLLKWKLPDEPSPP